MVNPRGVSSHHVFQRAFGDAYRRRENVGHAMFCTQYGLPFTSGCKTGEQQWIGIAATDVAH